MYDYTEYTRNTLVVTRNPYGFVNVNEEIPVRREKRQRALTAANKHKKTVETVKMVKTQLYQYKKEDTVQQKCINTETCNDDFKRQVVNIWPK